MVLFKKTNESLNGIIASMQIQEGDNILAIGGSGDQAFAMLVDGANVIAVDNSRSQIDYIRNQRILLHQERYQEFMRNRVPPEESVNRNEDLFKWEIGPGTRYFTQENLQLITERLKNKPRSLRLLQMDIFMASRKIRGYNKVYLSNVLTFNTDSQIPNKNLMMKNIIWGGELLRDVSKSLPEGGLIYIAQSEPVPEIFRRFPEIQLEQDHDLTSKAKELEFSWAPTVLRKLIKPMTKKEYA